MTAIFLFRAQLEARLVFTCLKAIIATSKTGMAARQWRTTGLLAQEHFILFEASDIHCVIAWKSRLLNYSHALGCCASTNLAHLMSTTA